MSKLQKIRQRLQIPGWIFAGLMVIYSELMLHLWTNHTIAPLRLVVLLLVAAAIGALTALITGLFPAKAGKWIGFSLGTLAAIGCMVEYFIHVSFQNFMPLSMMAAGGAGVVNNLLPMVWDLIVHHVPHILAMILPLAAYALLAGPGKSGKKTRLGLCLAAVGLWALTAVVIAVLPGYAAGLTTTYEFDSAVRTYGMYLSLPLDVYQSNSLKDSEPAFELAQPIQTQPAPAPTESAAAEETQAPTEPPVVYYEQAFPIDFAALAQEETNSAIANLHSYVASQTPAMENEYTGLFKGKNLILITAEAFTGEFLDPELTPTLYRMATQGIAFENYYQPVWGAGTTGGEFTNVVGLSPNGGGCMYSAVSQDLFLTMGNQLQRLGYSSAAFHNNDYTFYSRHETHTHLGYDVYMGYGNGIEEGVSPGWPESDDEMFRFTIPQYIDQEHFSLYYMTVSGHSNYYLGCNDMAEKHYDRVKDLDLSESTKCYIAANLDLEDAMTYLLEQLEEKGIADDTVVVIAADHYPYGLDYQYLNELFGEESSSRFVRDRNRLIIWSGCLEGKNIVVEDPVYSLDILPTLSNLFDVDYDSRLLPGRDVFSDTHPLVLWHDYSWITDKGIYDGPAGTFTPYEGVEVEEGYVEAIAAEVRNKITYSRAVQQTDYFDSIAPLVEKLRSEGIG